LLSGGLSIGVAPEGLVRVDRSFFGFGSRAPKQVGQNPVAPNHERPLIFTLFVVEVTDHNSSFRIFFPSFFPPFRVVFFFFRVVSGRFPLFGPRRDLYSLSFFFFLFLPREGVFFSLPQPTCPRGGGFPFLRTGRRGHKKVGFPTFFFSVLHQGGPLRFRKHAQVLFPARGQTTSRYPTPAEAALIPRALLLFSF